MTAVSSNYSNYESPVRRRRPRPKSGMTSPDTSPTWSLSNYSSPEPTSVRRRTRRPRRPTLQNSMTSPAWSLSNSSPVPSAKSSKFSSRIKVSFNQLFHQKENSPLSLRDLNHAITPPIRRDRDRSQSVWRPSLSTIFQDEQLLEALITFMNRSFNSENILFLQSARDLNAKIEHLLTSPNARSESRQNDAIDAEISALYHLYIASNAQRQINLSYACYGCVVLWFEREWSTLPLDQKSTVFDECVIEIELLMQTSVIYLFYASEEFEEIAQKLSQRNISPKQSLTNAMLSPSPNSCSMSRSTNSSSASKHKVRTRLNFFQSYNITPEPIA